MKITLCILIGIVVSVGVNILALVFKFSEPENLFDWVFDAVSVTIAGLLMRYAGLRFKKQETKANL